MGLDFSELLEFSIHANIDPNPFRLYSHQLERRLSQSWIRQSEHKLSKSLIG